MEPTPKTLTLTVPNGVLKKHTHHQPQQQQQVLSVYRECLKNHAASLGGHALDGCGEFMVSPSSNPSDPTSLTCAACGCHRNFHRRLPHQIHNPNPVSSEKQHNPEEEEDDDEEDEQQYQDPEEIDDDVVNDGETGENSSAPHMLLALSTGVGNQNLNGESQYPNPAHPVPSIISGGRKRRLRTKFSPEQKERMQDLSERLGWKMQKRDEGIVEESCGEIGIGKGIFKVWMHNNKHNHFHSRNNNFTTPTSISTLTPAVAVAADDNSADGNGSNIIGMRINGCSFLK